MKITGRPHDANSSELFSWQISSATPTRAFIAPFGSTELSPQATRARGKRGSACYSLPTGQIASSCSRANRTNPLSFIWLSEFARVEGKDGAGEIIAPVRPMNRRDRRRGAAGERDRQEYPNEAEGRRSRRTFCLRITPYLLDFTNVTTVCTRAPRVADFCLCGQDQRVSHLCGERVRPDPLARPRISAMKIALRNWRRAAGP